MGKHLFGQGSLAALSLGVIAAVQAQQAPALPDSAAAARAEERAGTSASEKIDKVRITATRAINAVDVQNVPAAVTVLQPESLSRFGLGNLSDIASAVPAMSVQ